MNINAWQWWSKLTPTNKLITALAFAVCTIWIAREFNLNKQIAGYRADIVAKEKDNKELNVKLVNCERENGDKRVEEMRQSLEQARLDKLKSDSLYHALAAAQREIKKALRNGKK